MITYKLKISPKDTSNSMMLENVTYHWQEGNCICVEFRNGLIRSYPMVHIWYIEVYQDAVEGIV